MKNEETAGSFSTFNPLLPSSSLSAIIFGANEPRSDLKGASSLDLMAWRVFYVGRGGGDGEGEGEGEGERERPLTTYLSLKGREREHTSIKNQA